MKPPAFDYLLPVTVDEALDALASGGDDAAILAGGQSLIPLLNMRFARPQVVIDINRVATLDTIHITDDTVTLGATVRLSTIEHDDRLREALPILGRAAGFVAHPQIRNRTTIGGSLCHADPAAELPAVAVALGARIQLQSRERGVRAVPAEDFFETVFTSVKQPDELLISVEFPCLSSYRISYDELARRHGDFPFVGLCLAVRIEEGRITDARAAAAGVADRPLRLHALEAALTGAEPSDRLVETAAVAASNEVSPPSDNHGTADFRRALLRTLVRRQLLSVMEVAV